MDTVLYPPIQPFSTGRLKVSELHEIYYEQVGNASGKAAVFLHGGPGGGISPDYRRFFDPQSYHLVLFDQRGCGKSTPHAELRENTTWDLVEDIERLREHLGFEKWQVFGGSWGSTLALAYAEKYPHRVSELILRGIFLARQQELDWLYQEGASKLFPDLFDRYLEPIPPAERDHLIAAYYKRLTSEDAQVRRTAAIAWSQWEAGTVSLLPNPERVEDYGADSFADAFARIECHYFINRGFFSRDDQLLAEAKNIRHIPGVIIQGRYDVVTPATTAWTLHKAWPEAELQIIDDAGHSSLEPGIAKALVAATDRFKDL